MKPALLFYGNCQAAALSVIFSADRGITEHFRVAHIPSFDDRIPDAERIGPEEIAATAMLFDQVDRAPFPYRELLKPECVRVTFPSLDFNLLWPFYCVNTFNSAPTPDQLWGAFPYGDRVVVTRVARGDEANDILRYYTSSSGQELPNLKRFAELEFARLQSRDRKCDVAMSDYVIQTFREQQLFWCVNHPNARALNELSHRLLRVAQQLCPDLAFADINETMAAMHPEGPLGFFHAPIHPAVVEHFQLHWYPADDEPVFGMRGHRVTQGDYLSQMIDESVRVRELSFASRITSPVTS